MGDYLKCPKCGSIKVEISGVETKSKINWFGLLLDNRHGNQPYTKKVHVQKKHCINCGYFW